MPSITVPRSWPVPSPCCCPPPPKPASCPISTPRSEALLARTALVYPVHACQPARCRGRHRLSAPPRPPRPQVRFPAGRRRVLRENLGREPPPPGALSAALPKAASFANVRGAPFAVEALQRRRPALGLRRRRPGVARPLSAAGLCVAGATAAADGGRHRALARRDACGGEPAALSKKIDAAERGSAAGSGSTDRRVAFSCG